jgi:hypothetical protein
VPDDSAPKIDFKRIYLDSVPLTASGWPQVAGRLKALLDTAASSDGSPSYSFHLPEVVAQEQEAQFLREYAAASRGLSTRAINGFLRRVDLPPIGPPVPPSPDEMLDKYRNAVRNACAEWSLAEVPIASPTIRTLLNMLFRRTRPFDENGKGLGDAMIYLSVIEDLKASQEKVGLLVTGDSDFDGAEVLALESGVEVITMTAEEAIEAIQGRLSAAARQAADVRDAQAQRSVEQKLDELSKFLEANLNIPLSLVEDAGEEFLRVGRVDAQRVLKATAIPGRGTDAASTTLSAKVQVRIETEVVRTTHIGPPTVRAGQSRFELDAKQNEEALMRRLFTVGGELKTKVLNVPVDVEATAGPLPSSPADNYDNIVWLSAKVQDKPWKIVWTWSQPQQQTETDS